MRASQVENGDVFSGFRSEESKIHRSCGLLPSQQIRELISRGSVRAPAFDRIAEHQIQPASLDLRLGETAYRVRASFAPGHRTVEAGIHAGGLLMSQVNLNETAIFEKGCVYIVPLAEELSLPDNISARANPKSSTGRLDIFTRLITDYGEEFEHVRQGYKGRLYAEITSRTFSVAVRAGMTLNQLRFLRGSPKPSNRATTALQKDAGSRQEALVYDNEGIPSKARIYKKGIALSARLCGQDSLEIIAYKAKKNAPVVDLERVNHYDPEEFWDLKINSEKRTVVLDPGDFYILASKENVSIPPDWAAEMIAIDPGLGECRIHYAGFFDPGFGYSARGTRAVLEVRAHEVPFLIQDGQSISRLVYIPLLAQPDKIYGTEIGSSYQSQGLCLSRHFKGTYH